MFINSHFKLVNVKNFSHRENFLTDGFPISIGTEKNRFLFKDSNEPSTYRMIYKDQEGKLHFQDLFIKNLFYQDTDNSKSVPVEKISPISISEAVGEYDLIEFCPEEQLQMALDLIFSYLASECE